VFNANNINLLSLPFVTFEQKNKLPQSAGVYLVLDEYDKVRYVGLSKNIKGRWARHHRMPEFSLLGLVKIVYLEVSDASLLPHVEIALIQHFSPDLNKAKGGSTGAGDGDFVREIFFRLTEEEFAIIESYCLEAGRSKSDVLRELVRRLKNKRPRAKSTGARTIA
jgi:hypothetical protein